MLGQAIILVGRAFEVGLMLKQQRFDFSVTLAPLILKLRFADNLGLGNLVDAVFKLDAKILFFSQVF